MRRYLAGEDGDDVVLVHAAIQSRRAVLPPVVVTELLSEKTLSEKIQAVIGRTPIVPLLEGYWERAGLLRASILRRGLKARLADCLIAQACLDSDVPFITNDRDFRHFVSDGLVLLVQER